MLGSCLVTNLISFRMWYRKPPNSTSVHLSKSRQILRVYIWQRSAKLYVCTFGKELPISTSVHLAKSCQTVRLYIWQRAAKLYVCTFGKELPNCTSVHLAKSCQIVRLYSCKKRTNLSAIRVRSSNLHLNK